jgi:hypothetical protein
MSASSALAIAQGLNALIMLATETGVNYRRLLATLETARAEGREPSEAELLASAHARDEAIDRI